ncbi:MAG: hypothetical protein IJ649_04620 [Oscillospiraceae bacterium]|nr:hypothetical protein [Oscillospiraceae bacterium]
MLGKLLKHEFRATGRIMLPLILAELLVSVLAGLAVRGLDRVQNMNFLSVMYVITLIVFFLGLFAIGVVALVLMIQRFYRSLLRDEGYLSMTLPVSVDEHIWAKLITSFVWFAAVGLLSLLAMAVMLSIGAGFSMLIDPDFLDAVRAGIRELGAGNITLYVLEAIVLAFAYGGEMCLRCYAAMAIGGSASDHKLLYSFVAYFGIGLVLSIVSSFVSLRVIPYLDVHPFFDGTSPVAAIHSFMGVNFLIAAALFAVFYFVTRWFMKNKLNLA